MKVTGVELFNKIYQQRMRNAVIYPILRRFMSTSNSGGGVPFKQLKNSINKREKLPDLPEIIIADRNKYIEVHQSARKVKYGDMEFMECNEGYILTYIKSHITIREPQKVFYGLYFGKDSPLNKCGPVNGKQSLEHANDVAILHLIESFPNIEVKKLCICHDNTIVARTLGKMGIYSENGYRNNNGQVLHNVETYKILNKALRLRNDLQIRVLYTPADATFFMRQAERLARLASTRRSNDF